MWLLRQLRIIIAPLFSKALHPRIRQSNSLYSGLYPKLWCITCYFIYLHASSAPLLFQQHTSRPWQPTEVAYMGECTIPYTMKDTIRYPSALYVTNISNWHCARLFWILCTKTFCELPKPALLAATRQPLVSFDKTIYCLFCRKAPSIRLTPSERVSFPLFMLVSVQRGSPINYSIKKLLSPSTCASIETEYFPTPSTMVQTLNSTCSQFCFFSVWFVMSKSFRYALL